MLAGHKKQSRPDWQDMDQADIAASRNAIYQLRCWIQAHEEAQHRDDVRAFRARHLPDGLLRRDAEVLTRWIAALPQPEGTEATRLGFPPLGGTIEIDTPTATGVEARTYLARQRDGDTARELVQVAHSLSTDFGWWPSSAAAWLIMKDMPPAHPEVTVRLVDYFGNSANLQPTDQRRDLWIRIMAPLDTPPTFLLREIVRIQEAASSFYAYPVPSTTRPYRESTLEAVRFALSRNDGRGWVDVLREWNNHHPESEFELSADGAAEFGKNVRRCYQQVMGRKLEWARRPGKAPKSDD